ncbi:hypothetical protein ACVILI_006972 [Mesorhizobium sp. USDA 4775]|nr:hypothetical protein MCHK_11295 [Mesorhizobium huakuii 7653R]
MDLTKNVQSRAKDQKLLASQAATTEEITGLVGACAKSGSPIEPPVSYLDTHVAVQQGCATEDGPVRPTNRHFSHYQDDAA